MTRCYWLVAGATPWLPVVWASYARAILLALGQHPCCRRALLPSSCVAAEEGGGRAQPRRKGYGLRSQQWHIARRQHSWQHCDNESVGNRCCAPLSCYCPLRRHVKICHIPLNMCRCRFGCFSSLNINMAGLAQLKWDVALLVAAAADTPILRAICRERGNEAAERARTRHACMLCSRVSNSCVLLLLSLDLPVPFTTAGRQRLPTTLHQRIPTVDTC